MNYNEVNYRDKNDYEKIYGKEFVDILVEKHKWLEEIYVWHPCMSETPLLWADIIYDFLKSLCYKGEKYNNSYGNIYIDQIKEKWGQLTIYHSSPKNIYEEVENIMGYYRGRVNERMVLTKLLLKNAGINLEGSD